MAKKHPAASSPSTLEKLFSGLEKSLCSDLGSIRLAITHAPTKGRGSEERWKRTLRHHLPPRYRVDEAVIIDSAGSQSEQIDIVIFDNQYSALFYQQDELLHIPIESVFAVFEAKQEVTKEELDYASKKFLSVRKLKRTSVPIRQIDGTLKRKNPHDILCGILALKSGFSPAFSTAFRKQLAKAKGKAKIDFVCCVDDGLYPWRKGPGKVLVSFIFNLLSELQKLGNPPAVDYLQYLGHQ